MIATPDPKWLAGAVATLQVLVALAVALRLFARRRPPGVTLAWLFLIILVPFAGAVGYLLIGERRLGARWIQNARTVRPQLVSWLASIPSDLIVDPASLGFGAEPVARLTDASVAIPVLRGHRVALLADSDDILRALITEADAARHTIHLEFYIWSEGGLVDEFIAALIRAAGRGVKVRALIDYLGSRPFLRGPAPQRMRDAGIEVIPVLPVNPIRIAFVRLDLRDHRKIAVFDRRVAFTGSMNLADPRFFKQDAGVGEWVDAMARVEGPAAWVFEAVSGVMTAMQISDGSGALLPPPITDARLAGPDALQIFPSGPLIADHRIEPTLLSAIYAARREITLTTPYLVPGDALLVALTSAALRGVAVTLIVPRRNDSTLVTYASAGYNDALLAAGVRILLFEGGLLHTKSVLVDDELAIFGTVNLDLRSFELNFEVSTVVYGGGFARQLRTLHRRYEGASRALDLSTWRARPKWRRFAENAAGVMSPLL